jgi:hypothetical protein
MKRILGFVSKVLKFLVAHKEDIAKAEQAVEELNVQVAEEKPAEEKPVKKKAVKKEAAPVQPSK